MKITVRDVDSIKTMLGRLPESEAVCWIDDKWLEQVQGETGDFLLPDMKIVDDIKICLMKNKWGDLWNRKFTHLC